MAKKKTYVSRLILFGNKFEHDVLALLGGMMEEYDLGEGDFGAMEEANILLQYVSHLKGHYAKARVVYVYNKSGLIFHHMHMEGPCFELKNQKDVTKLKSIQPLLEIVLEADELSQHLSLAGLAICKKTKFLPNISNKIALNLAQTAATNAQALMMGNAKQVIIDYITANFSV